MRGTIWTALAGLAALTLAGAASAATVTINQTGTVFNATDLTGVFDGDPSAPGYDPGYINGLAYSLTYTFDTEAGYRYGTPGQSDILWGPGVAASLTINGVTQTIVSNIDNGVGVEVSNFQGNPDYLIYAQSYYSDAEVYYGVSGVSTRFIPASGSYPIDLEAVTSLEPLSPASGSSFTFAEVDEDDNLTRYASGSLAIGSVTISYSGLPAPVPLPATAGLTLAGLGALLLARRRAASAGA